MLMTLSLFRVGHASTTGLTSTSRSPPPTAYTSTAVKSPANGGITSGKIVKSTNPAAEQTWAITIDARYPILSTKPIARRSTRSCSRKFNVISSVICDRGIP